MIDFIFDTVADYSSFLAICGTFFAGWMVVLSVIALIGAIKTKKSKDK